MRRGTTKPWAFLDVTQSAIDLAQTDAVVQALSALGDTLTSLLPEWPAPPCAAWSLLDAYYA